MQHLDLAQLGDNIFWLLLLAGRSVVLLFAEILKGFRLGWWTSLMGLPQAGLLLSAAGVITRR